MRSFGFPVAALGLTLALSACATQPVYVPQTENSTVGYSDEQISGNRYRVTFNGSASTRRNEVEDYLLRRSAEVTLGSGYRHFVFDTRDTEAKTQYRQPFGSMGAGWGWGAYPRPYYWSSWRYDPFFYDSFYNVPQPVTRYNAYAEILLLTPDQARDYPESIDAQDVLDRLAPPPPPPPA